MNNFSDARRNFLRIAGVALGASVVGLPVLGAEAAKGPSAAAQKIADHFSGVRTMTGEFVQFGPKGEQTGGKFFLERPGKLRFNYDGKSAFRVIADGKSVMINNQRLKTYDLYPLSKTPLKLLLDDQIDLSGNKVKSVNEEADLTTITLVDKSVFGNARIAMMFDPNSYELKQWTITDAQGKDTTVMVFNVKQGVDISADMFKIDYSKVNEQNEIKNAR